MSEKVLNYCIFETCLYRQVMEVCMDRNLYLMLLYLLTLDIDLSDDEKTCLKDMYQGLRERFQKYDVDDVKYDELGEIELPSGETRRCKVLEVNGINDVECAYNSLIRGGLKNNKENSVLIKVVESLLAEKSK